jgi:hypothetical protein
VWVSEPATPYTYKTTSFLRFGLGDGERVNSIVAWRDLVFVFKRSRYWVLTGASVSNDGTVRFQKRAIEAGVGSVGNFAACASPQGVFFVAQRGIYLTTGGEPQCISDPIAPIFGIAERLPPFYTGPTVDMALIANARLAWVHDTLYFTFQQFNSLVGTTIFRTFIWHQPTNRWSYWTLPARFVFAHDSLGMEEAHFIHASVINLPAISTGGVGRVHPGLPGDAWDTQNPTAPFYLGPFRRLAKDRVTRVRQLKVWGGGSVDAGMAVDFDRTVRSERQVLTASLPGTSREARTYRVNQHKASYGAVYLGFTPADKAGEKAWSVQRVVADVAGGKPSVQPDADGG